jgi:hypothetical protein
VILRFWRNPEFVRHRRSELRQTRALSVVVLVIVVCLLVGLACWISRQNTLEDMRRLAAQFDGHWNQQLTEMEQRNVAEFCQLFYYVLMFIQTGVLTFWSLLSCAQSISGEREHKTWDFQRITRLSEAEMLVGKVLGEPVLAYFIVLCCLPIAVVSGLVAGVPFFYILSAYTLIIASALFIGFAGIWLSSLLESRSRGIGLIGALGLSAFVAGAYGFHDSDFPGLAAFSPISGLLSLFGQHSDPHSVARLFGAEVSWFLMSLLLYSTFGAWLVVMIVENIKRDYDEVRPLSRWQAVACATFLNLTLCLAFYPRPEMMFLFHTGSDFRPPERIFGARNFATTMVLINVVVLFAVGLATLTPHERLKVWWRRRLQRQATLLSEDGLPWPWLILSAVAAYAVLAFGLFVWRRELPLDTELFLNAAVQFLVVCVFVTRDVLFVQWCKLTRLRSPMIKGFLYLCLYYGASAIVAGVFAANSHSQPQDVLNILTPAGIVGTREYGAMLSGSVTLGVVLQLIAIGVLLRAITFRLKLPGAVHAAVVD